MAIKSKSMNLNLLTYERRQVKIDALHLLVEKMLKEKANHYVREIYNILVNSFSEDLVSPEEKAIRYLTLAFFEEFIDYFESIREVSYFDKELTKITIHHIPFNKGQID